MYLWIQRTESHVQQQLAVSNAGFQNATSIITWNVCSEPARFSGVANGVSQVGQYHPLLYNPGRYIQRVPL